MWNWDITKLRGLVTWNYVYLSVISDIFSKYTAQLFVTLEITKSHSRPHISDDNPYSESLFKTLKYCPAFTDRFGSLQDSIAFCRSFFTWYNTEHRHSGIGLSTPKVVHYGRAKDVIESRKKALESALRAHPEWFVRGIPLSPALPKAVWIDHPANVLVDRRKLQKFL